MMSMKTPTITSPTLRPAHDPNSNLSPLYFVLDTDDMQLSCEFPDGIPGDLKMEANVRPEVDFMAVEI